MATNDIATKYQKLTPIEHILKRPGMYIGGTDIVEENMWIMNESYTKIVEKEIKYIPGLYKIFDEIIVNTYDQSVKDNTLTTIKVEMNEKNNEISVFNDGKAIDVVIHPKENIYVPELIFGHLLTSTSFEEGTVRITSGVHGLGAKLTAIFSIYFRVEVGDPVHKKKFKQIYQKNLSIRSTPEISEYDKPNGFVKITFRPDLKYFKIDFITQDVYSLFARRTFDIAALVRPNVKVYFGGKRIVNNNFDSYVALYTDSQRVKIDCDTTQQLFKEGRWKIIVTKSNGNFNQISFVNAIYTKNGGQHVNYILGKILKDINALVHKQYGDIRVRDNFIKDQFWIFISSIVENPMFSSQTKDELTTPASKFGSVCELNKTQTKNVYLKLGISENVKSYISQAQTKELEKAGQQTKIKGIVKLNDANFAGTKRADLCTLILTEGDSAKSMAISGISAIPKSNDVYGVFPLRGKLLNVREATHKQIVSNEEFINLQKILGLTVNKVYTEENVNELRYGHVLLMMDADVDGSHIKGLFINMMDYYWPSLLKIKGFVKMFVTPVVKVTKGKQIISFNTLDDYKKWRDSTKDLNTWQIKYYKGLGTNTAQEAKEYFRNLEKHIIDFMWDEKSDDSIKLAFSKARTEDRKKWLKQYDVENIVDYKETTLTYYNFIHKELVHFSNADNIRSIPSMVDGVKPSQRKVLYACFKRELSTDVKVAQLVGYISEHTSYHHGEASLAATIINMAQNFVGSNNVNFLMPNGQFGTRLMGGKDHSSPRYIFTKLEKITRAIFRKEDDALLNYLNDDGYPIEPEYYVPIIPTVLVNGTEGIGTGYSTYVPRYNILDIITNLENRIRSGTFKMIDPWYNGFIGKIYKVADMIYRTKGNYVLEGKTIRITELPLFVWTETYKIYLDNLRNKYKFIKKIYNNSTESVVDFTITFENQKQLETMVGEVSNDDDINKVEKFFYLSGNINLTNMHLYNADGIIKKYQNVVEILNDFYDVRIKFYQKRKDYLVKLLKDEIALIESKIKFIELVISNKIVLFNKPKDKIIEILKEHKLLELEGEPPFDYLIKMSFYSLTKERIEELKKTHANKKAEYDILVKKTIEEMWLDDLEELRKLLK